MYIKRKKEPIIYFSNLFSKDISERMFKYFEDNIKWEHDFYKINSTIKKSPRLTAMYSLTGDKDYTYSGQTKKSLQYNDGLNYIREEIENFLDLEPNFLNGCLLNLYRDGNDSIAYHKDNEKDMINNGIVCVLSIGANRNFHIKHDMTKEHKKYLLENMSLVVMNPICQKEWKHAIFKEANVAEPRISLTFRHFK